MNFKNPLLSAIVMGVIIAIVIRLLDRHKVIDRVTDYFDPEIIFS